MVAAKRLNILEYKNKNKQPISVALEVDVRVRVCLCVDFFFLLLSVSVYQCVDFYIKDIIQIIGRRIEYVGYFKCRL